MKYVAVKVPLAGSHANPGVFSGHPRSTIARRDSGNGLTLNSMPRVTPALFHGDWLRLLFSSQMPNHGNSAASHTYAIANRYLGDHALQYACGFTTTAT